MSIGEQIRNARKKAGLTQSELAGDKYTASYISQIENGLINPSLKALNFIAEKLNKPIGFFCDDPEEVKRIAARQEVEKRVRFLINLGEAYLARGESRLALGNLSQAEKLFDELESDELRALLLRFKGKVKAHMHDWDEAEECYLNTLNLYKKLDKPIETARTYYDLSQLYFFQEIYSKDESCLKKALRALEEAGAQEPSILADIYNGLGVVSWIRGRFNEAAKAYDKALEYAKQASDMDKLAGIYMNISLNYSDDEQFDQAIVFSEKAVSIFESIENNRRLAEVLNNTGTVLVKQKKFDEALNFFKKSLAIFKELNDNKSCGYVLTELAKLFLNKKEIKEAEEYAEKALAVAEEYQDKVEKAHILSILGEIAQHRKEWWKAKYYFKQSIELLEEAEVSVELTEALHKYSELLLSTGETEQAAASLRKALENLRKL
jgi:tetratricopeptide (TPR) repeat protein